MAVMLTGRLGSVAPHAGGLGVGHVGVGPELAEDALLAVPRAELVADDRVSVDAHLDRRVRRVPVLGVPDQRDLVDDPRLLALQRVPVRMPCADATFKLSRWFIIETSTYAFSNH